MKKLIASFIALFAATMLFAAPGVFTVKSVKGTATYESAPGKYSTIKEGQELTASTFVDVKMSSLLVLEDETGKEYTIKAMSKDTIEKLTTALAKKTSGLKKTPTLKALDDAVEGTTKGTSTASTRAEDVQEDLTWGE